MSEQRHETHPSWDQKLDRRLDMPLQYDVVATNVRLRSELYKYRKDGGLSAHDEAIEWLAENLQGHEIILDIGCADGKTLADLRARTNHYSLLAGLDIYDQFKPARLDEEEPIKFVISDGSELGIKDESVDVVLALSVMYHLQPEKALGEFRRILKPGGRIIATTSGQDNKKRHRVFEKAATKLLNSAYSFDVKPPPIFSAPCNAEKLAELLPNNFTDILHVPHPGIINIDDEQKLEAYMGSLQTMSHACNPPIAGSLWKAALNEVARPVITQEISQNNSFEDFIDHHIFIARKPD